MFKIKTITSRSFFIVVIFVLTACGSESSEVGWNVQPEGNYSDQNTDISSDTSASEMEMSESDSMEDVLEAEAEEVATPDVILDETETGDSSPPICEEQRESTCNGRDSDGDGVVDDGCSCNYNENVLGVCGDSTRICEGRCGKPAEYELDETLCDGLDNDCDGEIDEGCDSSIYSGGRMSCALIDGGKPHCWGEAELGSPPAEKLRKMAIEFRGPCGLTDSNEVRCWGGSISNPSGSFVDIAAGTSSLCGITGDRDISCWDDGRLEGPQPQGSFVQISIGNAHACALTEKGEVKCWGMDPNSELDAGQMDPPRDNFRQISAGGYHTCGISTSGKLKCWGMGTDPEADENINSLNIDHDQSVVPEGNFVEVTAGTTHTCALEESGNVKCWGSETSAEIDVPDNQFKDIAAGSDYNCGLTTEPSIKCW